jgi:hypothetical protein
MLKKTKYGIKVDIFWHKNQTPVAIADIAKAKIFRLSF